MCSVAGITGGSYKKEVLTMLKTMTHRAPDDTGVYWHPVNSEQSVSTNLVYEDGTCIIREPTLPP